MEAAQRRHTIVEFFICHACTESNMDTKRHLLNCTQMRKLVTSRKQVFIGAENTRMPRLGGKFIVMP